MFRRPADMTVATFIGTPAMNIIPATVATTPSGVVIGLLGREIPAAPRQYAALQGLKRVEVGIRPQALRLVAPGPDHISGRVFLREPLGLEDEVLVETLRDAGEGGDGCGGSVRGRGNGGSLLYSRRSSPLQVGDLDSPA